MKTINHVQIDNGLTVQGHLIADSIKVKSIHIGDSSLVLLSIPGSDLIYSDIGNIGIGATANPNSGFFSWLRVGVGTAFPQHAFHINDSQTVIPRKPVNMGFTTYGSGSGTGTTALDGFQIGIQNSLDAEFNQQENKDMIFYTGNNNGTILNAERMRIMGATGSTQGFIGIGTATPAAKLEVDGASGTTIKIVDGNQAAGKVLTSDANGQGSWQPAGNGSEWLLAGNNGTTPGTDFIGTIDAKDWVVKTSNTERMRVLSGGNVGIGTTTPNTKLDIGIGNDNLAFYQPANNTMAIQGYIDGHWSDRTTYAGGCCNSLLLQPDVGNVGIGTTTPASKLDIEGGVSIGATYSGTTTAPANGAIIEGNVGIGTSSPTVKTHIYNAVDGIFTGLAIDNKKTYGSGSGINEVSRLILSLTETGVADPLSRVMGYISAGTEVETSSSNGFMAFGTRTSASETEKMRITSAGNVGIGTTAPGYKLDVQGSTGVVNINTNGNMQAAGTVYTSDQMFKTNIDSLQSALATIRQLKPKSYYFDTLNFNGEGKFNFQSVKQYGFIANDIENLLPELVVHSVKPAIVDSLGNVTNPAYTYRALNYNAFIPILTKGIQELQFKNDSLQSKVNNQDSVNTSLQNQVNQLTTNNTLFQNQLNQLMTTINNCCTLSMQSPTNNNQQTKSMIIPEGETTQMDVELNDAQTIVLLQNSPNPFAERTSISYYLPDNTGKAQILFYNTQGKLIQSAEIIQKGKGTLNVFASDLSNGIYTYTLVVNGIIIETKKMVKQ